MERETKKITTPDGKEVELKTYMTARERNAVQDIYTANMKINIKTNAVSEYVSGKVTSKVHNKLIEVLVVSFDGNKEDILNRILDGTPENFDFIVAELAKVQAGIFKQAK